MTCSSGWHFLFRDDEISHHDSKLESNGQYIYLAKVIISCRGCLQNAGLFGESVGHHRASLMSHIVGLPECMKYNSRKLMEATSACLCPVRNPEDHAPTKEEFQSIYSDRMGLYFFDSIFRLIIAMFAAHSILSLSA